LSLQGKVIKNLPIVGAYCLEFCLFYITFAPSKNYFKTKIIMGRGDKRTAKGKRTIGSFGKARPARTAKVAAKAEKKA
jgi:30S ribosomal protein S31